MAAGIVKSTCFSAGLLFVGGVSSECFKDLTALGLQMDISCSKDFVEELAKDLKVGEACVEALKKTFDKFDQDKSGKLEEKECLVFMSKAKFDAMNTDKDDGIDLKEFVTAMVNQTSEEFKTLDKDNDGQLEKDECPEWLQGHFKSIDDDKSGSISIEEFGEWWWNYVQQLADGLDVDVSVVLALRTSFCTLDEDGSWTLNQKECCPRFLTEEEFKSVDENGDNELDFKEFVTAMVNKKGEEFKKLDSDNNGQLEKAECDEKLRERFESIDLDNSGAISLKEYLTATIMLAVSE